MLSVKDLVKVYNTKGGNEVRALDSVSIDFPEKGMVFLLGRSGSGKSTLLNVTGGLDTPSHGEIIVKGRSSKDFTASDFDSYRNTYIGFVFQDYNLLNEFTVEENIAIALQLQSRPNDKEAVAKILEQVELAGLGHRKPNTLSGGQMQRVAIARALIKDPEIIMADEPTGALDSNTGKQILDTLKKLSETRLVIVVSHDRSFAEEYGDRIIELKDGKIISDKTKSVDKAEETDKNVTVIGDDTITVKDWSKVTEDDVKQIVEVMKVRGGETVITSGKKEMPEIKKILSINDNGKRAGFKKTEKVERREYGPNDAKFIKSRLPFGHALKMAGTALKFKPFKLIFTIFLSVIAFTLFGVLSTLMLYDPAYSVSMAMVDSHYQSVALEKRYDAVFSNVQIQRDGSQKVSTSYDTELKAAYTEEELTKLNQNSQGLKFAGVLDLGYYQYTGLGTGDYFSPDYQLKSVSIKSDYTNYFTVRKLCGFTDCGEEFLESNGFKLLEYVDGDEVKTAGRYPKAYDEIAISEYVFNLYKNSDAQHPMPNYGTDYKNPGDILNTTIYVGDMNFKVVGVYDVGDIPEKYNILYDSDSGLDNYQINDLKAEFEDLIQYSFHTVGFVSEDFYDYYQYKNVVIGKDTIYAADAGYSSAINKPNAGYMVSVYTTRSTENYKHAITLLDLKGKEISVNDNANQVFVPVYRVINKNVSAYRDALKSKFANNSTANIILDAINRQYLGNEVTAEDYILIYKSMVEGDLSYKEVVGSDMVLDENWYIKNYQNKAGQFKVVGVYVLPKTGITNSTLCFVSSSIRDNYSMSPSISNSANKEIESFSSNYQIDAQNEKYGLVLTMTDNTKEQSMFMLEDRANGVHYAMLNDVYDLSVEVAGIFDQMQVAFLIAGLIVGVFAALMLFNFISVGIENKKNEIGILRAVGARGIDVFKIFITEAVLITTICFILSSITSAIVCMIINKVAVQSLIQISFLNFRFINVLFILGVSLIIALLGTILPVTNAAKRTPVESIRAI